jgi:hypothetical protein
VSNCCLLAPKSGGEIEIANTYTTLEVADKQALEDLAGLVAVADVFEGFG